jgi:hypothetical protein
VSAYPDGSVFLTTFSVLPCCCEPQGESPTASYHGKNRTRSSVRFRKLGGEDEFENFRNRMELEAEGYFDVRVQDYAIPVQATKYYNYCANWTQILEQNVPGDAPFQVIGYEVLVSDAGRKYLHHLNTFATERDSFSNCGEYTTDWEVYLSWTPGVYPLAFPQNVGSLWGKGGYKSIRLVRFASEQQTSSLRTFL